MKNDTLTSYVFADSREEAIAKTEVPGYRWMIVSPIGDGSWRVVSVAVSEREVR